MVVFSIDAHKRTHTAVALDQVGRLLGELQVPATSAGHRDLLDWARTFEAEEVLFAVEDCRHVSGLLEADLLTAGCEVVRVPVKMMARHRRRGRRRGKSDPIDARAVGEAALREPDLPRAALTAETRAAREANLLVNHRDNLVADRTTLINRLRWHLHEIDHALGEQTGRLTVGTQVDTLAGRLARRPGTVLVDIAREMVRDLKQLNRRICRYETRIGRLRAVQDTPLQQIPGCSSLTAAKILGEIGGDITRLATEASFGALTGTAPVPVASGNTHRVRLNRGGNRQLNRALHTIALYQMRTAGRGQEIYLAARARKKTHREAMRVLKRALAKHIYRTLTRATAAAEPTHLSAAA